MKARNLFDAAFATIPKHIDFPWVVYNASHLGKPEATHSNESFRKEESQPEEFKNLTETDSHNQDLSGFVMNSLKTSLSLHGVGVNVNEFSEVNLAQAEREEAAKRAAGYHEVRVAQQQEKERLQAASKRSSALAVTNQRVHSRGFRGVKGDPDSAAIEVILEKDAATIEAWDVNRRLITLAEQEKIMSKKSDVFFRGCICLFNSSKGFGFITPDIGGPDLYFTRDSATRYDPEALMSVSHTNDLLSESIRKSPQIFNTGEKVEFLVRLNDNNSQRKLRAISIRGPGGSDLQMAVAIKKGRRFTGVVKNIIQETGKAHFQAISPSATDSLEGMSIVEKGHAKGFFDVVYHYQPAKSEVSNTVTDLHAGLKVEYYLLPEMDKKNGKGVAVFCTIVPNQKKRAHSQEMDEDEELGGKRNRTEEGTKEAAPAMLLGDGDELMGGW